MSEPIEIYRRELSRLKAELAGNPTYVQIQLLQDLIAAHEKEAALKAGVRQPPRPSPAPLFQMNGTPAEARPARPESRKAKIRRAVAELIQKRDGRVKRADILAYLDEAGILSGPKSVRVLAPILTEAKEFATDGKGYWSMVPAQVQH